MKYLKKGDSPFLRLLDQIKCIAFLFDEIQIKVFKFAKQIEKSLI